MYSCDGLELDLLALCLSEEEKKFFQIVILIMCLRENPTSIPSCKRTEVDGREYKFRPTRGN
jgi:hypothetical protein